MAAASATALALAAALATPQAAMAAEADAAGPMSPDAPELEQVLVTAPKGSAASGAPATAPLDAVQPTAMVSRTFIEDSVADTSDYTGVIVMTPSL